MAYQSPINSSDFSEVLGYTAGLNIPSSWNTSFTDLADYVSNVYSGATWFKVPVDDGPWNSMAHYQQRVKQLNITISASASAEQRQYATDGTYTVTRTAEYDIPEFTLEYIFVGGSKQAYFDNVANNTNIEVVSPTQKKFGADFYRKDAKQDTADNFQIGTYEASFISGGSSTDETGKLFLVNPESRINSSIIHSANEVNDIGYVMSSSEKGSRQISSVRDADSPNSRAFILLNDFSPAWNIYDWATSSASAPRTSIAFPAPIPTWDMQSMKILGIDKIASESPPPLGQSGTVVIRTYTDSISASWIYFFS